MKHDIISILILLGSDGSSSHNRNYTQLTRFQYTIRNLHVLLLPIYRLQPRHPLYNHRGSAFSGRVEVPAPAQYQGATADSRAGGDLSDFSSISHGPCCLNQQIHLTTSLELMQRGRNTPVKTYQLQRIRIIILCLLTTLKQRGNGHH